MTEAAIGGYFALSQDDGTGMPWLDAAIRYRSARSALAAILKLVPAEHIWAPFYICSAVDEALTASGKKISRYKLSPKWGVPEIKILQDDWLLCVDYFGLCFEEVRYAQNRYGKHRVLVDASQSLFFRAGRDETVVYSPRKFVGIPDGGLAITPFPLPAPAPASEEESINRCIHLRLRAEGRVEEGYRYFKFAEASLEGCEPVAMSTFTSQLLASVDAGRIANQREENYRFLERELGARGFDVPELPGGAVPLCCPCYCDDAPVWRNKLEEQRIYTPTYWPDVNIPHDDAMALRLRDATLFLPCDQRFTPNDLTRVVKVLERAKTTPIASSRVRPSEPPHEKSRILVFPCGSEPAGEIHNALRYSIHVELIGASSIDDHGRFRFARYYADLPNIADPDFFSRFNRLIREQRIDMVFPTHDTVCELLARRSSELSCAVINGDPETTRIARSKRLTLRCFAGEPWIPDEYASPEDVVEWPAIVKPDKGQGGQGVVLVTNADEAAKAIAKTDSALLVEYLPGEEISVDCFTDRHEKLVWVGPRTRERIRAGISMRCRVLEIDTATRSIATAINCKLKLRGPWFFQLKRDRRGNWKLLEFSCRVAGAMVTHRAHGVNLPLLAVLDQQGRSVIAMPNTAVNLIDRAIETKAWLDFDFDEVFVDFDDTLVIDGRTVPVVLAFLYTMLGQGKRLTLITRHAGDLKASLAQARIASNLFDCIVHLKDGQCKSDFVTARSIFVDNHFPEREKVARKCGVPVFDIDALEFFLR